VQVKALACELPHRLGLPLSRLSIAEIRQYVISQGLVAEIKCATLWRWLSSDALRPWQHRSWIFPRDPSFADKAGPILDLYERVWEGAPLGADDYVFSADEKTSIQARRRKQPTLPPASNRPTRVEHEYFRQGAWTCLAAWDVHRAKVFGRCEVKAELLRSSRPESRQPSAPQMAQCHPHSHSGPRSWLNQVEIDAVRVGPEKRNRWA
jgi:hypothetical protein